MSDDRSSHESLWECHTTGSDLGTDGISREDAPAALDILQPLVGVETNGNDGRVDDIVTLTGQDGDRPAVEEGRSPVEEAGREVEGVEDEELGYSVEEGEEAALALGASSNDSDLSWLQIKRTDFDQSEGKHLPCDFRDDESDNAAECVEGLMSAPESQATEMSSSGSGKFTVEMHSD